MDYDGIDGTQYYVNCNTVCDMLTCGSPLNPCKTINYTWNIRANGPTQQRGEYIICFTGICLSEELISPSVSGFEWV